MYKKTSIIGRKAEIQKLESILQSTKSEFVTVYGRRRVGKTFLIREFFEYRFAFRISGLANATTEQQLFNFDSALRKQSSLVWETPSDNWLIAFERLVDHLEQSTEAGKKVVFFDELPWFDTPASDFMTGLEHFWNSWASARKDICLIVCGSAASWMINELINNAGGLHNRVTKKIKLEPFSLQETEELLVARKCALSRYQVIQLYMAVGGIPYYLEAIEPDMSAAQNIQQLFFDPAGLLRNEFFNLYRSLFRKHEVYEKIVEVLSTKNEGLQRKQIIELSGISSGGTLTKILADLEESGFITSYASWDQKQKNITYRLSDYYTTFFFKFIKSGIHKGKDSWINLVDSPIQRAWQGYTFEQVCLDHVWQIKKALGISGVQTHHTSWRGVFADKAAQIDLVIDRRDQVINLCECKFSLDTFSINKDYADKLRSKIAVFKQATKTRKAVFLTFITTYGVHKNKYANMLVQNEVMMDDLFA